MYRAVRRSMSWVSCRCAAHGRISSVRITTQPAVPSRLLQTKPQSSHMQRGPLFHGVHKSAYSSLPPSETGNTQSSSLHGSEINSSTLPLKPRKTHRGTESDLAEVVRVVKEDNCSDIVTIDVRSRTPGCDFFVIATCKAGRHMNAVAELLVQQFKDRRRKGETLVIEGTAESQWIVVNMIDIQIHLMEEPMRQRLELEKLWTLGADDDQLRDLMDSRPEYYV